ncbi:MAG: T9SS type A sorting domain-containing protein [Sphingobacteriales bacterium]|nr:MAG: T9SS type A sorting domain-containing protein [Sphingobacteriales bacterium]
MKKKEFYLDSCPPPASYFTRRVKKFGVNAIIFKMLLFLLQVSLFIGYAIPIIAQTQQADLLINPSTLASSNTPILANVYYEPIDRGLYITEVGYELAPPEEALPEDIPYENRWGYSIELTLSEDADPVDLSNYSLVFYAGCNTEGAILISERYSFELSGNINSGETHLVDFSTIAALSNVTTTVISECSDDMFFLRFAIALVYHNGLSNQLLNFVSLPKINGTSSNFDVLALASDGPAFDFLVSPVGTDTQLAEATFPCSFSLTDLGWLYTATPSLGTVNSNLSNCSYNILSYTPTGTNISFNTVPRYVNEKTPSLTYSNNGVTYFRQPSPFLTFNSSCTGLFTEQLLPWVDYYSGITETLFPWTSSNSSDPDYQNNINAITTHVGFTGSLDYFYQKHNLDYNWITYPFMRYSPLSGNFGGSGPTQIVNRGATLTIIGHEVTHRLVSNVNEEFDEAFCDIFGTCIEKFILDQNGYDVSEYPSHQSQKTFDPNYVSFRDAKNFLGILNTDFLNSSDKYFRLRAVTHWFYLLEEGPTEVTQGSALLPVFICGIGDQRAARVVFEALHRIKNDVDSENIISEDVLSESGDHLKLRNHTIAAIDDIIIAGGSINESFINESNFVKAQILNAWSTVHVGEADFVVANYNPNVKICLGNSYTLHASSIYGDVKWIKPDESVYNPSSGAPDVAEYVFEGLENGTFNFKAQVDYYTDDETSIICSLEKPVQIEVKPLIINQDNPLYLCYNAPLTLTHSYHSSVTGLVWKDPAGNVLTPNTDGSLTVTDPVSGTYSIWGMCEGMPIADEITVTVIATPTITFIQPTENGVYCLNDPATLTIEESYVSYDWTNTVSTTNEVTGIANEIGTTTYYVTVTDTNGCTASATTTVTVFDNPQVDIETGTGSEYCTAILTATASEGTPGYSYQWSPNLETTTEITVNIPGIYYINVTDANDCIAQAQYNVQPQDLLSPPDNNEGVYRVGTTTGEPFSNYDIGNNTETWTGLVLKFAGKIIVPAEQTLIIDESVIEMRGGENSEIIIEPGGRLEINQATLKADNCNDKFWKGISVMGSEIPYGNDTGFETEAATGNYGVLVATNSKIENARIGSCNGLLTDNSITAAGGLIRLNNTEFKDNGIAIKLEKFAPSNHQVHDIQNCTVTFTQNNPPENAPEFWWDSNANQPIGLWATAMKLINPLYNNRFHSTMTETKSGIGMRLNNVATLITADPETDPDNPEIFEFSGLSKGIDVYNTLTVMKNVNISDQNFQTTKKQVTLNGTVGSIITGNTFTVPPGSSQADDTYGLLTYGSIGLVIENNLFRAEEAEYNPYTFGAIFDNTEYGSFVTHVRNNFFDSRLNPATQFIGYNGRLLTNCNAYDDCDIDWHLAEYATLPPQGICDIDDAGKAHRTHWHFVEEPFSTIDYDDYHIINESSSTLYLNIDNSPQSDPFEGNPSSMYVAGVVNVQFCGTPTSPVYNTSCTVTIPIEGIGMAVCDDEENIEGRIYIFLRNNQQDSLLALLHCLDTEWAIRLLVGTYVDEGLFEQALHELQNLPETPENAEFIALYQAIIQGGIEGSGKSDVAISTMNSIAENSNSPFYILAESVLANYRNKEYIRHGQPVNLKLLITPKDKSYFQIIPNPAASSIVCKFVEPLDQNCRLFIYDCSGKIAISVFVPIASLQTNVNIDLLNNGIYFCRLEGSGSVQKLVVVK